jgi:hypothetical protein
MQNKPTFYMLRILQVVDVSDVLLIVVVGENILGKKIPV